MESQGVSTLTFCSFSAVKENAPVIDTTKWSKADSHSYLKRHLHHQFQSYHSTAIIPTPTTQLLFPKVFHCLRFPTKKLSQPQYVRYVCWYYCIKSTQAWITRNYYRLGSTFLIYCISEKSISCDVDWTDDDNVVRWIRKSDERTRRGGMFTNKENK